MTMGFVRFVRFGRGEGRESGRGERIVPIVKKGEIRKGVGSRRWAKKRDVKRKRGQRE